MEQYGNDKSFDDDNDAAAGDYDDDSKDERDGDDTDVAMAEVISIIQMTIKPTRMIEKMIATTKIAH